MKASSGPKEQPISGLAMCWWNREWKTQNQSSIPQGTVPARKKFPLLWKMDLWEVEWTGDTTLKRTFCSSLNFSMGSTEVKLISLNTINVSISNYKVTNWYDQLLLIKVNIQVNLDTALHFKIFFGTLASCSSSGTERSSLPCNQLIMIHLSLFVFDQQCNNCWPARGSCQCRHPWDSSSWP